jgi:hypothetical protein
MLSLTSPWSGWHLAETDRTSSVRAGVPVAAWDLPMLREVFGRTAWLGTDAPDFARQTHHAAAQPDPSP